jgi:hypothetical protein
MDRADLVRRRFVLTALPACAGACVLLHSSPARADPQTAAAASQPPGARHKFDSEMARKLTYRELFTVSYSRSFIPLALLMTKRLGRDATLDLLKTSAAEQAAIQGAEAAKGAGAPDLAAFKALLNGPGLAGVWTKEDVVNNESVYEVRVSECLWAATFRAAGAGECGYAGVCHGDYAFASAFNPRLQLTRDRTLMQGHAYCNHRYTWKK